jgi:hypothetical protein
MTGLGDSQIQDFIDTGYLKLEDAFDPELARKGRDELWSKMGLSPDEPSGWRSPVIRLGFQTSPTFAAAANTPRLHAAYDALVGEGRWIAPTGLGTFPVRFPSDHNAGDTGWHVDMSFDTDNPDFMSWRANVKSSGRALLMLFLFSDVTVLDAPTIIREGSHAIIARQLMPAGEAGLTLAQLASDGFASSAHCREVLATGTAGTVYLCHPFIVHSAQPHSGREPRFMAQPPLLPRGEFDPALPPSPLQIAIRRACGFAV